MANAESKIVPIPKDCYVLNWENKFDYKQTNKEAEIIHYWGITAEKKLFHNRRE